MQGAALVHPGLRLTASPACLQLYLIKGQDLVPTTHFIGVFNMDYYVHAPLTFKLLVRLPIPAALAFCGCCCLVDHCFWLQTTIQCEISRRNGF